ncbi:MAG: radical SAM protein [Planctomycetes bacterium]|nr:radical SAM protein [Planctomycetota bacterium]
MIRYEGTLYRPPSEADSLILQATIGCSYNNCTFCGMYLDKKFRVRKLDELRAEIEWAKREAPWVRKVFLADGDALMARASFLGELCDDLNEAFPMLRRISVYASPQSLQVRSIEEMSNLRERGLTQYYVGIESGHNPTLERLKKGVSAEEWADAAAKATAAGVKLSAMILLGAGGPQDSVAHATASAELINRIQPRFLSTLVMTPHPGTPLAEEFEAGIWQESTASHLSRELYIFLEQLDLKGTIFRSNHVSNLDVLAGTLPKDQAALLDSVRKLATRRGMTFDV